MIESVEGVEPELQAQAFFDRELFLERHVEVHESWRVQPVDTGLQTHAAGLRRREAGRIQPIPGIVGMRVRITSADVSDTSTFVHISGCSGRGIAGHDVARDILRADNGDRERGSKGASGGHLRDARELPAVQQSAREAVTARHVRWADDVVEGEDLPAAEIRRAVISRPREIIART